MRRSGVKVGACQTQEILGDVAEAIRCIQGFCLQAADEQVELLLFPECFLQGYLITPDHVSRHAVELGSSRFRSVLAELADVPPDLVVGVIERSGGALYNSAVVIHRGKVAGVYRKTHLTPGEALFDRGSSYPTFEVRGLRYGINICYDTRFADAAAQVAAQQAHALLVPSQNMMKRQLARAWMHRHNQIRAGRVRETGMWLISADVTGERGDTHVGYGPTSIMNPSAQVISQVPIAQAGMTIATIPASQIPQFASKTS